MKLYIKNMVCNRCIMLVRQELEKLNIQIEEIQLGYARIRGKINRKECYQFNESMKKLDLELITDKKSILIERVKNLIIEMVHYSEELPKVNYSAYMSDKLSLNYTYISNTFSEITGTTIENYIIAHKIERVKELLMYNELSLTQISDQMHYSSVAHLSNQFKKVTGQSPSCFKKLKAKKRHALEEL